MEEIMQLEPVMIEVKFENKRSAKGDLQPLAKAKVIHSSKDGKLTDDQKSNIKKTIRELLGIQKKEVEGVLNLEE